MRDVDGGQYAPVYRVDALGVALLVDQQGVGLLGRRARSEVGVEVGHDGRRDGVHPAEELDAFVAVDQGLDVELP